MYFLCFFHHVMGLCTHNSRPTRFNHDDVMKWKHFPHNWPFVRGIHRPPVNSPHKGQWRGALMFSLICVWINGWVNNHAAGDSRRYRAHYDVIVMKKMMQQQMCSWRRRDIPWYQLCYSPFTLGEPHMISSYAAFQTSWASYQIRKIAGCACAGNAGNVFPRCRYQRKPQVSDSGMHHGTCVTHVPWCMSGSLTCGDGKTFPAFPAHAHPQFCVSGKRPIAWWTICTFELPI